MEMIPWILLELGLIKYEKTRESVLKLNNYKVNQVQFGGCLKKLTLPFRKAIRKHERGDTCH